MHIWHDGRFLDVLEIEIMPRRHKTANISVTEEVTKLENHKVELVPVPSAYNIN